MEERAFNLFKEAWDKIKEGNFFDDNINTTFEYTLKSLWKSEYMPIIKADIKKHFASIYERARGLGNPPPFFYIIISLADNDLIKEMQSLLLFDFIKSNASEEATFQVLNFIETFADKNIPTETFVKTIINHIKPSMDKEMVEALSNIITMQHPEYMRHFLKKFLDLSSQDDTLLKGYVRMTGRKAFLALTQMATPVQMNKIFKNMGV